MKIFVLWVCCAESTLTVDVEACSAGDDACVILGWHCVPASIFFHGRLDDHAQVATVVLVHAGKENWHKFEDPLHVFRKKVRHTWEIKLQEFKSNALILKFKVRDSEAFSFL